jgi:hypothetical protein
MSDDNFVSRWSRLKRQAAQPRKTPTEVAALDAGAPEPRDERASGEHGGASGEARKPEPPFDPASLPPVDSIVAGSDIRAFLQKGVPADLTKAALRRAWTSDPAIRDFIGLAENQWDFTDPTSIPGFGPLQAADNVGQLVAQAMGNLPDVPDAVALSPEPAPEPQTDVSPRSDVAAPSHEAPDERTADVETPIATAASQHAETIRVSDIVPSRKGHGRALPK